MADIKTDLAAGLAALAEDELKALIVGSKQASIECVDPLLLPSPPSGRLACHRLSAPICLSGEVSACWPT